MEDVFYNLFQVYPIQVVLHLVGKGQVDYETGFRSTNNDTVLPCDAIKSPTIRKPVIFSQTQGMDEKKCAEFIVKVPIGTAVNSERDYLIYNNTRFTKLEVEPYGNELLYIIGEATR